ncbi:MAG: hypothetical protein JJU05_10545, partial [Verrucomicrobia bacterium]|nr:hypothetical protein [Verrucomicrobiota bacterium]
MIFTQYNTFKMLVKDPGQLFRRSEKRIGSFPNIGKGDHGTASKITTRQNRGEAGTGVISQVS